MSCRKGEKCCVSLKTHGRIAEIEIGQRPIRMYEE